MKPQDVMNRKCPWSVSFHLSFHLSPNEPDFAKIILKMFF